LALATDLAGDLFLLFFLTAGADVSEAIGSAKTTPVTITDKRRIGKTPLTKMFIGYGVTPNYYRMEGGVL
jgi:hypothetical protein